MRILELLKRDAKMSIHDMSQLLNITKTPIYERIKRMEKSGVIKQYVAIIDEQRIDDGMFVFCSVSLDSQHIKEIEHFKTEVMGIPEVRECYLMGGENDFLLKVYVQNLEAYHQFSSGKLAAIPNVKQIRSTFVLETLQPTDGKTY